MISSLGWSARASLTLLVPVLLCGCPRIWYLSIRPGEEPSRPSLCITRFSECTGKGMQFASFDIWEVGRGGEQLRLMWRIEPVEPAEIREIQYGVVPTGYREVSPASPLTPNMFYSVVGKWFFRWREVERNIVWDVYELHDFRRMIGAGAEGR